MLCFHQNQHIVTVSRQNSDISEKTRQLHCHIPNRRVCDETTTGIGSVLPPESGHLWVGRSILRCVVLKINKGAERKPADGFLGEPMIEETAACATEMGARDPEDPQISGQVGKLVGASVCVRGALLPVAPHKP
ncbi:hypothetical protein BLNAU_18483 [Blattamonas nauphoetae]|uniref:Uncharacterized protein n=1 Tax=Blattamonas nauphoetae TaxID=2049346 RepID=A0ABQ9X8R8_9EUKA|nr:hypothetical protein BLNAU_18483 [Blattamonas nauphoetae]